MNRRAEILARVGSIPAMPTCAAKVIHLLQDRETPIESFTRAIEHDPGITINVLRLANSAYFGGLRSVHSVREAIVRLGVNRVFDLVVALAVSGIQQQAVKGYDLPAGALWEHSVAVATAAVELANVLRLRAIAYTFTAGLLHDIGKVVLGTFLEVDAEPIMEHAFRDHVSFERAEQRVLGIDHTEVGAAVLESWNLPRAIAEVVRFHHDPDAFPGSRTVVDLVHIADALALLEGIGTGNDGLNYRPSTAALERLRVTTQVMETVTCRMLSAVHEIRGLFSAMPGGRSHGV